MDTRAKRLVAGWNSKMAEVEKADKDAKARGEIVGRFIRHPYADGFAYYKIVAESARTVKMSVITGIGDDWVLPAWGTHPTISRRLAIGFIKRRDALDALFKQTRKEQ